MLGERERERMWQGFANPDYCVKKKKKNAATS
jgi:hypothetical protein